jgi:hypothetical protein
VAAQLMGIPFGGFAPAIIISDFHIHAAIESNGIANSMEEEEQTFEEQLLATDPATWRVQQAIILGWYDGPLEGLCALSHPQGCFYFTLVAEQRYSEASGQRLFRIDELPLTTMEQFLHLLTPLGPVRTPVWLPLWYWPDRERQQQVEQVMEQLIAQRTVTPLIIETADMEHFRSCWLRVRD